MWRTENVQEEAMKLIWFVSLTSVVFMDMISSLSAQSSCWSARGAGMGELVKGHQSNPAEEPGQATANRDCGHQVWADLLISRAVSKLFSRVWKCSAKEGTCGFTGVLPYSMGDLRCWSEVIKVITPKWFSIRKARSLFYFGDNKELAGIHGNG